MRRPLTVLVAAAAALTIAISPAAASGAPATSSPSSASPAVTAKDLKLRWGTFTTKKVTGKGTKVIKLPKGAKRGLVTLSAGGKGKVSVQVLKKNRKPQGKALVSTQALPYKGTTLYGLDLKQYDPTYLRVTSTSTKKWTVTIQPLHMQMVADAVQLALPLLDQMRGRDDEDHLVAADLITQIGDHARGNCDRG